MGGKSSTTTSNNAPPQAFTDAYNNINNRATSVANVPYEDYPGQLQADFSPDQLAAFGTISNSQGIANPYINEASQHLQDSTRALAPTIQPYVNSAVNNFNAASSTNLTGTVNPGVNESRDLYRAGTNLTADDINSFQSPYTDSVVNATQRQFDNQNRQQQSAIQGDAASKGAFGGDREAVAQGIAAGQQQLSQAPVIAGLRDKGYQTALQAAETQNQQRQSAGAGILQGNAQLLTAAQQQAQNKIAAGQGINASGQQILGANEANNWLNSQAAAGFANLGNEAQSTALQGAAAQLQSGALQQQQAQQGLNIPYEQFLARKAYPFQTTGWLSNISQGLGGASGGTSSTTSPGPSVGSQVAGAALLGTGILGQTGAFGSNGYLTGGGGGGGSFIDSGAFDVARGGAIPHRAGGGGLTSFSLPGGAPGSQPIDLGSGVPSGDESVVPGTSGMGSAPTSHGPALINRNYGQSATTSGGDSFLGSILKGAGTIAAGVYGGPAGAFAANAVGSQIHFSQGGGITCIPGRADGGPPMLPVREPGGGGLPSAGGGDVQGYLARQAAGAYHPPAPSAPQPALPRQPESVPDGAEGAHSPSSFSPDEISQLQDFLRLENNQGNAQASLNGSPGWRGGPALHRDAGGALPEPPLPPEDGGPGADNFNADELQRLATGEQFPRGGRSRGALPHEQGADPGDGLLGLAGAGQPPGQGLAAAAPQEQAQGAGLQGAVPPPPVEPQQGTDNGAPAKHSPWNTLLYTGLGILGGTSPYAGVNIGRGALQGLEVSQHEKQLEATQALHAQQQKDLAEYRKGVLANRGDSVEQRREAANERFQAAQQRNLVAQERNQQLMAVAALRAAHAAESAGRHATQGDILNNVIGSLNGQINPDTQKPYTKLEAYQAANGFAVKAAHIARADDQKDRALDQRDERYGVLEGQGNRRLDQNDQRIGQGGQRLEQGNRRLDLTEDRYNTLADQADQRIGLREQAQNEAEKQHGLGNQIKTDAANEAKIRSLSNEALRVYQANVQAGTPVKPEEAQRIAAGIRERSGGSGLAAPAAPAAPPAPADAPAAKRGLSEIWGE